MIIKLLYFDEKIFSKKYQKYCRKICRNKNRLYLCIVVTKVLQKYFYKQPLNYSYHEFEKFPNQIVEPPRQFA